MNYKRMWLSLKKIVEEEYEMYANSKISRESYSEEADYILGEMERLEDLETLPEAKERELK